MSLPASLTWLLIRNNNSFLVKRNGAQFSTETGNLTNKHSQRYSGLVNKRVVDVSVIKGKPVISLRAAKGRKAVQPANAWRRVRLAKHFRANAKTITGNVKGYRGDLTKAALARYTKISRVLKAIKKKAAKKPAATKAVVAAKK
eukprot:TRINITY_DN16615_c0_g2_i2.p1 TRINITY_DN16615_c0_g2~~TRINITY_DN16615_c0_g2_i2.p1  ORF type:complete len:144 (-),score=49.14 TRINITY_DN16615_c0_g2_i2:166-597(-)